MTPQDIEKLKAFCDEKGIEMISTADSDVWEFKSKDIWDGVEFAECVESYKGSKTGAEIFEGKVYKIIDWFRRDLIYIEGFEYGWPIELFKPSNQSSYVEKQPIKVRIELMQTDSCDRTVLRFSSNRAVEIRDQWEFFNHIEESIEAFLNRKP